MSIIRNDQENKDLNNIVNLLLVEFSEEKVYLCQKEYIIACKPCCDDCKEVKIVPVFEGAREILKCLYEENYKYIGYEKISSGIVKLK